MRRSRFSTSRGTPLQRAGKRLATVTVEYCAVDESVASPTRSGNEFANIGSLHRDYVIVAYVHTFNNYLLKKLLYFIINTSRYIVMVRF